MSLPADIPDYGTGRRRPASYSGFRRYPLLRKSAPLERIRFFDILPTPKGEGFCYRQIKPLFQAV